MEVSIKAPIVQAAVAIGGFMAYLAEVGAERDDSEQTKTRWALGHYAAKLQPAAPQPAAPQPAPAARKSRRLQPGLKRAAKRIRRAKRRFSAHRCVPALACWAGACVLSACHMRWPRSRINRRRQLPLNPHATRRICAA